MGLKMVGAMKLNIPAFAYPIHQEEIGSPDPMAPEYVGTYSPTPVYFPTGTWIVVPSQSNDRIS
jgi:hypothetical protein